MAQFVDMVRNLPHLLDHLLGRQEDLTYLFVALDLDVFREVPFRDDLQGLYGPPEGLVDNAEYNEVVQPAAHAKTCQHQPDEYGARLSGMGDVAKPGNGEHADQDVEQ